MGGTGRTIGSGVRRTQRGVQLTPAAPLFRDRAVSRAALAEWPGGAVGAIGSGGPAVDGRSVTVVAFDSHQVQALPGPWTAGANARYIRHSYNFTDTLVVRFGTGRKGAARTSDATAHAGSPLTLRARPYRQSFRQILPRKVCP